MYKHNFSFKLYLDVLDTRKFRSAMSRFHESALDLEMQCGRNSGVEKHLRICTFCKVEVEDEYKTLNIRTHFIPR
jgi:hypothetical protein